LGEFYRAAEGLGVFPFTHFGILLKKRIMTILERMVR